MSLSKVQLRHFEHRLLEERALALEALNRNIAEHSGEDDQDRAGDLSSIPTHLADLGTDTIQDEMDAADATRVSRELAEIDAALERLYHTPEKFGMCDDTGRPIPLARLEVIPWARTSVQAGTKE